MMKPADALFIETAKLSLQDIFRIYRIPMHMGGLLDRATNNNIEHQSLEFVRDTLRPILKNWENELDRKLLFDNEKMRLFFRFNVDAMLRGDTQSRAEYYQRALGSVSSPGWMTANEVRLLENLNPIADADTIYSPAMNNITPDAAPDNTTDNNDNTGTAQTGE
jgi:HK97 family phage portal protein